MCSPSSGIPSYKRNELEELSYEVNNTSHPRDSPGATLSEMLHCYASLSVVRLGRGNVDATVDDSAMVFG
jgi:hypothetical protein